MKMFRANYSSFLFYNCLNHSESFLLITQLGGECSCQVVIVWFISLSKQKVPHEVAIHTLGAEKEKDEHTNEPVDRAEEDKRRVIPVVFICPSNKEDNTLRDPVNSHEKKQLNENSKVSHLSLGKAVLFPNATGELEQHEAVEESIETEENNDDQMKVEKLREILAQHTGNSNTWMYIQETPILGWI